MDRFTVLEPRREELPGFHCGNRDCDAAEWDQEDLTKCEACGVRFCSDCVLAIDGLWFCNACRKCEKVHHNHGKAEKCGDAAVFACENCGNLLCAGDTRGYSSYDSETGYAEVGYVCRGGCAVNPTEAMALEVTA